MAISLQELEEDWLNYKPAGARPLGGRRALMGFNYQISLSLNRFFDKVLNNDSDAIMAFEGLSDLAELREEIVYLTQVKTTLTTDKLKDAILEFLVVDSFLEDEHPEVRSSVRYQVACRATNGNVRQDLSADELGLTLEVAPRWEKVQAQMLPYVIQGDPSLELVVKLWRKVAKPFDFVAAARGTLLQLLAAFESSDRISEELLKRWQDNQIIESPPGVLLHPSAFQDLSEGQTRILVGERPTLEDLNAGCFMERDTLVSSVLDELNSAASYDPGVIATRRLPIIWISGGSGVGKSALLLQTLQRVIVENDTPVNYLRHFPDQIPESLTYWGQQGVPALIAVDDLYAPGYRSSSLWSLVSRLSYEAPYVTILTCGPDDYREAFEKYALSQGAMQITHVEVPPLSEMELKRYKEWYALRTQQEEVKSIKETNFVVTAFLLDRRRRGEADIGEFTIRLQQRLEAYGLLDVFFVTLAINWLGIEAPAKLFEGKRDTMAQLVKEGLFQQIEIPNEEESVFWFHPALAKKIYDILVPPNNIERRAVHLSQYFSAIFEEPSRATSLLQLLSNEKQRRLPDELIKVTLMKIGDVLRQINPPNLNIGYLFLWRKAALQKGLSIEKILPPSLFRRWLTSSEMNREGWGLLWQILWDYISQDERDTLTGETIVWLESNMDLPEWNYVWQKLWAYKTKDDRLVEVARQWLADSIQTRGWGYVFHILYDAGIREDWMLQAGMAGLLNSPVTPADKYLWPKVESLGPAPDIFLNTLTQRLCNSRITYISALGVKLIGSYYSKVGIEPLIAGLAQNKGGPGWPHLYLGVLDHIKNSLSSDDEYRLISIARDWLIGREGQPEWAFVWRGLLDITPDDPLLQQQGRDWLLEREGQPEWNYVWQRLLDITPDDPLLQQQGRDWLSGREDTPEWSHVWRRLLTTPACDSVLLQQGRDWLSGREDTPEWSHIWRGLLDITPNDLLLQQQGRDWLLEREGQPEWNYVWQRLLDITPDDPLLQQQGRDWLSGREDTPEYRFVKRKLRNL